MEITMIAGQRTMKQSRIDLANTRDYRCARILGHLTAIENRAKSLALDTSRPVSPQGRGRCIPGKPTAIMHKRQLEPQYCS